MKRIVELLFGFGSKDKDVSEIEMRAAKEETPDFEEKIPDFIYAWILKYQNGTEVSWYHRGSLDNEAIEQDFDGVKKENLTHVTFEKGSQYLNITDIKKIRECLKTFLGDPSPVHINVDIRALDELEKSWISPVGDKLEASLTPRVSAVDDSIVVLRPAANQNTQEALDFLRKYTLEILAILQGQDPSISLSFSCLLNENLFRLYSLPGQASEVNLDDRTIVKGMPMFELSVNEEPIIVIPSDQIADFEKYKEDENFTGIQLQDEQCLSHLNHWELQQLLDKFENSENLKKLRGAEDIINRLKDMVNARSEVSLEDDSVVVRFVPPSHLVRDSQVRDSQGNEDVPEIEIRSDSFSTAQEHQGVNASNGSLPQPVQEVEGSPANLAMNSQENRDVQKSKTRLDLSSTSQKHQGLNASNGSLKQSVQEVAVVDVKNTAKKRTVSSKKGKNRGSGVSKIQFQECPENDVISPEAQSAADRNKKRIQSNIDDISREKTQQEEKKKKNKQNHKNESKKNPTVEADSKKEKRLFLKKSGDKENLNSNNPAIRGVGEEASSPKSLNIKEKRELISSPSESIILKPTNQPPAFVVVAQKEIIKTGERREIIFENVNMPALNQPPRSKQVENHQEVHRPNPLVSLEEPVQEVEGLPANLAMNSQEKGDVQKSKTRSGSSSTSQKHQGVNASNRSLPQPVQEVAEVIINNNRTNRSKKGWSHGSGYFPPGSLKELHNKELSENDVISRKAQSEADLKKNKEREQSNKDDVTREAEQQQARAQKKERKKERAQKESETSEIVANVHKQLNESDNLPIVDNVKAFQESVTDKRPERVQISAQGNPFVIPAPNKTNDANRPDQVSGREENQLGYVGEEASSPKSLNIKEKREVKRISSPSESIILNPTNQPPGSVVDQKKIINITKPQEIIIHENVAAMPALNKPPRSKQVENHQEVHRPNSSGILVENVEGLPANLAMNSQEKGDVQKSKTRSGSSSTSQKHQGVNASNRSLPQPVQEVAEVIINNNRTNRSKKGGAHGLGYFPPGSLKELHNKELPENDVISRKAQSEADLKKNKEREQSNKDDVTREAEQQQARAQKKERKKGRKKERAQKESETSEIVANVHKQLNESDNLPIVDNVKPFQESVTSNRSQRVLIRAQGNPVEIPAPNKTNDANRPQVSGREENQLGYVGEEASSQKSLNIKKEVISSPSESITLKPTNQPPGSVVDQKKIINITKPKEIIIHENVAAMPALNKPPRFNQVENRQEDQHVSGLKVRSSVSVQLEPQKLNPTNNPPESNTIKNLEVQRLRQENYQPNGGSLQEFVKVRGKAEHHSLEELNAERHAPVGEEDVGSSRDVPGKKEVLVPLDIRKLPKIYRDKLYDLAQSSTRNNRERCIVDDRRRLFKETEALFLQPESRWHRLMRGIENLWISVLNLFYKTPLPYIESPATQWQRSKWVGVFRDLLVPRDMQDIDSKPLSELNRERRAQLDQRSPDISPSHHEDDDDNKHNNSSPRP